MYGAMASPQFPIYSPGPPRGNGPSVRPVFGAGPDSDPGYLGALRAGGPATMLGQLRMTMAILAVVPVLILGMTPFIVRGGRGMFGALPYWIFVPLVGAFLVALVAGLRAPRPLRPGLEPLQAAGAAAMAFRQAIFLRFALSDAVILLGLPLAVIGHSVRPYAAGFALGYPLLVFLALPSRATIERMRRRLESGGAESHLWAVLLAPIPPPEPEAVADVTGVAEDPRA
jgi:hypothetical protein